MAIKNLGKPALGALIILGISALVSSGSIDWSELKTAFQAQQKSFPSKAEEAFKSIWEMRANEKTGTIEPEWIEKAVAQANNMGLVNRAAPIWENVGPDNIGGRTRAFLIDKDNSNLMLCGGVSGGMWRSTNKGNTWVAINDAQESLIVNCIAQAPNGDIYYGTGESGFTSSFQKGSGFLGVGVYKSTDRGQTFTLLNSTKTNTALAICNNMVAHPSDGRIFIATETGGIQFTSNGGTTWARLTGSPANCKEIEIDKNGVIWASSATGNIFKSDAGANSMSQVANTGSAGQGRTSIAISPQDPNFVYLLVAAANSSFHSLRRTTDGGTVWTELEKANIYNQIFGPFNQGWFDNVISVNPVNKNDVILGGVTLAQWNPVDGLVTIASTFGAPWNSSYVHADKHVIEWDTKTTPPTLWVGTDGGMFSTQDRSTWTRQNRNLVTTQFFNVAANSLRHVIGGTQDNGSLIINGLGNVVGNQKESRNAYEVQGGDGFDCEFSQYNPKIVFTSTYYGNIERSGNGGQSTSEFFAGCFTEGMAVAALSDFHTTFTLWEANDSVSRLFVAQNANIWMVLNATNFSKDPIWVKISNTVGGNTRVFEMAHTSDGNSLFVAKNGNLYRIDGIENITLPTPNCTDAAPGTSTTSIYGNLPNGRAIVSVNVNPRNNNDVVVTMGGYGNNTFVYRTNNAMSNNPTWTNITGNIPQMPVYDAYIDPTNSQRILLGTELGFWLTENGGSSYTEANNGAARVPVFEIRGYEWSPWNGAWLYAGSHGRGIFRSSSWITGTNSTRKVATTEKLSVFPSPAKSKANLTFNSSKTGKLTLSIYNISGQLVHQQTVEAKNGKNTVGFGTTSFLQGYYIAKLEDEQSSSSIKFMVGK